MARVLSEVACTLPDTQHTTSNVHPPTHMRTPHIAPHIQTRIHLHPPRHCNSPPVLVHTVPLLLATATRCPACRAARTSRADRSRARTGARTHTHTKRKPVASPQVKPQVLCIVLHSTPPVVEDLVSAQLRPRRRMPCRRPLDGLGHGLGIFALLAFAMRACAFIVGIVGRIISHKIVLCRRIQYGSLQVHQFAHQPFSSALCLIVSDASSLPPCSSLCFHSIALYLKIFFSLSFPPKKTKNKSDRTKVCTPYRTAFVSSAVGERQFVSSEGCEERAL